ncbi:hypothetical protein CAPTEDRAFT_201651 [Capitella teleta]|uniref:Uncharacterized protein n=1 Tax=Capitella teleta TaxID=283909 RepID=R7T6N4_CAPTE|nr:hypothetical protein CAPTEDRAFT_201651 [Capitella teleta]|eukprot:ELT89033.1 hypothetical protein CAPTEDRAFT_201651 [Capitella teleta]
MIKSDVEYIDRNLCTEQPKEQSFLIGRPAKHSGSQSVPRLRGSSSLRLSVCLHVISLLCVPSVGASSCVDEGTYCYNCYYDDVIGCQDCASVCADAEKWGTTFECQTYCPGGQTDLQRTFKYYFLNFLLPDWPHSASTSPRMITASAPHSTETPDVDGQLYVVAIAVVVIAIHVLFVMAAIGFVVCYKREESTMKNRENHPENPHSTKCQPLENVLTEPESSAIEEAEGNSRRESFVFATDLNTSTVSIDVWPGAEEFFRNFHVREEYDFRGIPAGENASHVSQFNSTIEVKVLAEAQNISSDEASEIDPCMAEMAFGGTNASIEVKDLEKEMSRYLEYLRYVDKQFVITLNQGGPRVEKIRQDFLRAGFAPEEFSIEYLKTLNFEMVYG